MPKVKYKYIALEDISSDELADLLKQKKARLVPSSEAEAKGYPAQNVVKIKEG